LKLYENGSLVSTNSSFQGGGSSENADEGEIDIGNSSVLNVAVNADLGLVAADANVFSSTLATKI